ncbi:MAG TPA: DSD1 family PLP-dependent enzyme [Candidatus Angelobacter sp.]|nr:DSD1 family PLP-dependent enzyme [Candidatus Angelobacter sp.]
MIGSAETIQAALPREIARRAHIQEALADLGRPGSRYRVATPAAIVDLDILEKNVATMRKALEGKAVALRPHAKSHKCSRIARIQVEAGAAGICCAKLGEAEALAESGVQSVLVTSPLIGADIAARAVKLAASMRDFAIVVDNPAAVTLFGEAARRSSFVLPVLIDSDVGHHRTGVVGAKMALGLAKAIASEPFLKLRGVQGYGGHWQHIPDAATRRGAVTQGIQELSSIVAALKAEGFQISTITGGGSGSLHTDLELGVLNEIQPGSYIFMDREYHEALDGDMTPDGKGRFETSLFVQARVVSANQPDHVTVDAGLKAFATDGPLPRVASAGFENLEYKFFGDEFGRLSGSSKNPFAAGDRIEFETPHCDPTIDRYDVLHLVRGDVLVEIAQVEGRGRSQ